ncbi:MAG: GspL/Epsl periplasmic domain-containing protein [Phycisphaeraceae bacterium]
MKRRSELVAIFLGETACRLAIAGPELCIDPLDASPESEPEAVAAAIADHLRAAGVRPGPAALLLPPAWCLSARLPDDAAAITSQRGWRREALFQLEELLPVSAEEVVADFVPAGDRLLGVCVRQARVRPWLDAFAAAGVEIGPVTTLAWAVFDRLSPRLEDTDLLVVREEGGLNLLRLEAGRPIAWHLIRGGPGDARQWLGMIRSQVPDTPLRLLTVADPDWTGALADLPGVELAETEPGTDAPTLAAEAARRQVQRRTRPAADFRRGPLGGGGLLHHCRRELVAVFAAAAALLLALTAGLLIAATDLAGQADALQQRQETLYREVNPDARRTPRGLARRLVAQRETLRTSGGTAAASAEMLRRQSATRLLADVLVRLPEDVRVQVDTLRCTGEGFELTGRVRAHADASRLASALQADGTLETDPARTTTVRDGAVGFTLNGRRASAPPAPGALASQLPASSGGQP